MYTRLLHKFRHADFLFFAYFTFLFLALYGINSQYIGPAYLSDEIGYLTKAAALSGHTVDHATSWHGGYSIILTPLFFLEIDPFYLWQLILALNAFFICAGLFFILKSFQHTYPSINKYHSLLAVIACSSYPSWLAISGYAFASSAFIFFFSLCIFLFSLILKRQSISIYHFLFSIFTGYLFWIHPLGLPIAALSVFIAAIYSLHSKRWLFLFLHIFIVSLMLAIYKFIVHQWLLEIMSPEEYEISTHYRSIRDVLGGVMNKSFIINFLVIISSKISYFIISTFGIYIYAVYFVINKLKSKNPADNLFYISIFAILAPISIATVSAIVFSVTASSGSPLRVDHWIYGRYSEMALLPAFFLGLLSPWSFRLALPATAFVLISGISLHYFINDNNLKIFNNLVNIQSFWPLVFEKDVDFLKWFYIGATGIFATFILGKRFFWLLVLPIYVSMGISNTDFHRNILDEYSKPSSLVDIIQSSYPSKTCIGIDDQVVKGASRERQNLYSYYLYKYDFRRMSQDKWLQTCNGPFLTFDVKPFIDNDNVKIIAKVHYSSLFLIVKNEDMILHENNDGIYPDLDFNINGLSSCQVNGCFIHTATDATLYSQTGVYKMNSLISNHKQGFLFYGPYKAVKANTYFIKLQFDPDMHGPATLDILANGHEIIKKNLHEYEQHRDGSYTFNFTLNDDVYDLEVRLSVSRFTDLVFHNYRIGLFSDEIFESPALSLDFSNVTTERLIKIENFYYYTFSQVGKPADRGLESTGKAGFLLYGPYQDMKAGKYKFTLHGNVLEGKTAWVDIISTQPQQSHVKLPLNTSQADTIIVDEEFLLEKDANDLEIRVFVDAHDEVTLTRIELKQIDI